MTRDIDLFSRFETIDVGMSVPTLDDRARGLLEPWAPPIEARLRCLQTLAEAGLKTFVSFAPAYPPTGDETPDSIAAEFASRGVDECSHGPWMLGGGSEMRCYLVCEEASLSRTSRGFRTLTSWSPFSPTLRMHAAPTAYGSAAKEGIERDGAMGAARPVDATLSPTWNSLL
jgi:hypothetical protein